MENKIRSKEILAYLKENPVNCDTGLTNDEIENRVKLGLVNTFKETPNKTIGEIIRSNLFTLFNFLCFSLLILILVTGYIRNAIFALALICNILTGIIQEVRAKKTIEKLSILNQNKITVLRNGKEINIEREEIVQDDILVLKKGSQAVVDVLVLGDDILEVDESLLTGESDYVIKKRGDIIYSGSFIMQGSAKCQVYKIGKEIYINQLGLQSKTFKVGKSEIQKTINNILKVVTVFIIPVGTYLFITQLVFVQGQSWNMSVLRAATRNA